MTELAVNGGSQVWSGGWPAWPSQTPATTENVLRCLASHRWAISGPRLEDPGFEERFAQKFADFLGLEYCVPTANGSSGLVIALEALDIGIGDEVIVPGLTWVASASTVMAVNALPVVVDVDGRTMCIDPEAVRAAIGPRTRAVNVVHLYNNVCDLTALRELCRRHGLALIEDCAQAHGAAWEGRKVGGWGDIGAFSMQQTKLLTAGEGGAATTRDEALYRRMYQLRSDGRSRVQVPRPGEMELSMLGEVMGSNYCMSELSAAVLLAQLQELPRQNTHRAANAQRLDALLEQLPGVAPVQALPQVTERTHYYYTFRIDPAAFADHTAPTIAAALRAETGAQFHPVYPPLSRHPLLRPGSKRRYQGIQNLRSMEKAHLPEAERAHRECVTLHHSALLAEPERMQVIADAIEKVQRHADRLVAIPDSGRSPL
ncbi:DegT/DnrJ/EryC1/StrS family aminotransferase [Actinomadura sp. SCN-SB]|uniref:DegT/DnrJ/EryC1/StrS family aminotransferase n=1 Tax=Actinomadura sp. SCN-SB TaxID=3373092 RepID=UPI00375314FA